VLSPPATYILPSLPVAVPGIQMLVGIEVPAVQVLLVIL